jgi:Holliday junction DNA helicase RuvB
VRRVCLLIAGDLGATGESTPFNVLFVGPSGSGKTELAERAARALELPLLVRDGPEIRSRDQLLEDMLGLAADSGQGLERVERHGELPVLMLPRMALFIDEIHALSREVVDSLLKLTEPNRHRHEGRGRVIDASRVRFMGATTEFGQMPEAFENRFRPFELEPYSIEESVEMLRLWQPELPEEVYEPLALAGHLIPRSMRLLADEIANALGQARRFADSAGGRRIEPREVVRELLDELGVDELGLSTLDRNYLRILCQSDRAVGLERLANELGRREGQLSGYIEPFLIRLGFVQRSDRGRVALPAGRAFLENPTLEQVAAATARLRRHRT